MNKSISERSNSPEILDLSILQSSQKDCFKNILIASEDRNLKQIKKETCSVHV